MKILNFGSCNVDYVYSLDHIVNPGETETSNRLEIFSGGKGLNQSIALARAGVKVFHAGCVGKDGEFLLKTLKENDIDISFISEVKEKNGHAIIQVSSEGENSIFLYPGSNEMITKNHIDCVLANFSKGDIILLQNEINNIDYIIKRSNEIGMTIVFNPSPYNDKLEKIDYNMISYLVLNEVEAQNITGCSVIEEILQFFENKYPNLKIMLTLGRKGCIYKDAEYMLYHPSFKVDAVDTTAAGDTFTGYFISGIVSGKEIKETLRFASAASAIAVTKNGASPSIPHMVSVIDFINELDIRD